jgi:bifunctional pyridoxal-dependent enzyme with beta-cystathionase and maltose regulon repressor activities
VSHILPERIRVLLLITTCRHAGVFVWVDLRQYLDENSTPTDLTLDSEVKLFKRLLGAGVVISQGSSFGTEELGWYRISFAVEEDALNMGLKRLGMCLHSIKNDGWGK